MHSTTTLPLLLSTLSIALSTASASNPNLKPRQTGTYDFVDPTDYGFTSGDSSDSLSPDDIYITSAAAAESYYLPTGTDAYYPVSTGAGGSDVFYYTDALETGFFDSVARATAMDSGFDGVEPTATAAAESSGFETVAAPAPSVSPFSSSSSSDNDNDNDNGSDNTSRTTASATTTAGRAANSASANGRASPTGETRPRTNGAVGVKVKVSGAVMGVVAGGFVWLL